MHECSQAVVVCHAQGLNLLAAAMLAQTAGRFTADVHVSTNVLLVDGKSVLGLMALGAQHGAKLTVAAYGHDAPAAIQAVTSHGFLSAASDEGGRDARPFSPGNGRGPG